MKSEESIDIAVRRKHLLQSLKAEPSEKKWTNEHLDEFFTLFDTEDCGHSIIMNVSLHKLGNWINGSMFSNMELNKDGCIETDMTIQPCWDASESILIDDVDRQFYAKRRYELKIENPFFCSRSSFFIMLKAVLNGEEEFMDILDDSLRTPFMKAVEMTTGERHEA